MKIAEFRLDAIFKKKLTYRWQGDKDVLWPNFINIYVNNLEIISFWDWLSVISQKEHPFLFFSLDAIPISPT